MYEREESWAPKNWCFWTVVLEKTLDSPLDYKEIKPVHHKGNQSWTLIERTDAKAETPILWPPDARTDPDAGKDWRREEKGKNRGWDGWMASLMQWTWVWVSSRSWWWTGKPGVLQSMGSQRVRQDWATEPNWTELIFLFHQMPLFLIEGKLLHSNVLASAIHQPELAISIHVSPPSLTTVCF